MCAAHRRSEPPAPPVFADAAAVAGPSVPPRAPGRRDRRRAARARRAGVTVADGVVLDRDVVFDLAEGAQVQIGADAALGAGCRLHVGPRARVRIGAGSRLGERCVITALREVTIGERCVLADEVVLIDADPIDHDVERPIREQGLQALPVAVGDGARIGPSAALLRGARVAPGARIGAHAVVSGQSSG
jgi:acetyltransferase-like isoleucine patch superfamily enzyme